MTDKDRLRYITYLAIAGLGLACYLLGLLTAEADHLESKPKTTPFTNVPPQSICKPPVVFATELFHLGYEMVKETEDKVALFHKRTGNWMFVEKVGEMACVVSFGNPEIEEEMQ